MENIWSTNRYVNLAVNILLSLVGLNIMHIGQLLLPIICLLIFVDNKFIFKVNSPFAFIVLCLFAISFYGFSYREGFYSVMGFTLPMAYYIGSNIVDNSEKAYKKIVYLFAFSMAMHVILNIVYEYIAHGAYGLMYSSSHYDIWTRQKISSTIIAIDIDMMIASLYFLLFHEKQKWIKRAGLVLLVVSMIYLIIIGRRTQLVLLGLVMIVSFVYEMTIIKTVSSKQKKHFIVFVISVLLILLLLFITYKLNLFNIQPFMDTLYIVQKIKRGFVFDERINLLLNSIKLLPRHLFGGRNIEKTLGLQVHNFWLDIYDYAGIVSFAIITVYSIMFLKNFINVMKYERISKPTKVIVLGVFICIFVQLNLEPMMTGHSIFVIICVIIGALIEGLIYE